MVSVSRGFNLKMVEYVIQRLKTVLANYTEKIFKFYKNKGYTIKTFLTDREFECIRDSLPGESNINTTTKNDHVSEIEHRNCVIKERAISLISTLMFKNTPGRIIIELIWFVGIWINQEPSENGVLDVYYPRNKIMVQDLAYGNECKFRFWYYVEASENHKITNDMEEQTVSGIRLGTNENFQGSYKIPPLKTSHVVPRKQKIG